MRKARWFRDNLIMVMDKRQMIRQYDILCCWTDDWIDWCSWTNWLLLSNCRLKEWINTGLDVQAWGFEILKRVYNPKRVVIIKAKFQNNEHVECGRDYLENSIKDRLSLLLWGLKVHSAWHLLRIFFYWGWSLDVTLIIKSLRALAKHTLILHFSISK